MLPQDVAGSLGEFLLTSLKTEQRNKIIQVNGLTDESHTVQDMLTDSVQVAAGLRKLGVLPEDVIVIVGNYCSASIATVLGSIFQGAAPFPMDPSMKQLELEHMFKLAKPKLVLARFDKLVEVTKALDAIGYEGLIFSLDGDVSSGDGRVQTFASILDPTVDVEAFACTPIERLDEQVIAVLPSSGTTGLPKGVALTHKGLLLQSQNWDEKAGQGSCLQVTPLFWISGFLTLLFSLIYGNKRVYLTDGRPENIIRTIASYKIDWTILAPIFLAKILQCPDLEKSDVSDWRWALVGGAAVPHSTINLAKKKLPSLKLGQAYGATEVSGIITPAFDDTNVFSAGKPVSMHSVKIVDPYTNEEVAKHQRGEIIIKSPTLLKGYLSYDVTQTCIDSQGYYHTGDVGYLDQDGYLFITGRHKELIKVKNHQVPPAELEDVIRGLTGVVDAAVVGIPHEIDQYHPRALVIKEKDSTLTEQQIIQEVADKLSETKQLFGGVQFVDFLPRNTNGKLKRGELSKLVKL